MYWLKIAAAAGLLMSGLIPLGCQTRTSSNRSTQEQWLAASRARMLVMPGQNLLSLTGENGELVRRQEFLLGRRDGLLNVGRIPDFAPVYVAQIRTWDQQQIVNGRPNEFFIRTNRSLEINGSR